MTLTSYFNFRVTATDGLAFAGELAYGESFRPGALTKTLGEGGRIVPILGVAGAPIGTARLENDAWAAHLLVKGELSAGHLVAIEAMHSTGRLGLTYDPVKRRTQTDGSVRVTEIRLRGVAMGEDAASDLRRPGPDVAAIAAVQEFRNAGRDVGEFYRRLVEED